jgi:glutaredoxin 3
MKSVEIYSSPLCGYCHAAKRLLNSKGVTYSEVNVLAQPQRRSEMMDRANGRHTVPQIFIGETMSAAMMIWPLWNGRGNWIRCWHSDACRPDPDVFVR